MTSQIDGGKKKHNKQYSERTVRPTATGRDNINKSQAFQCQTGLIDKHNAMQFTF